MSGETRNGGRVTPGNSAFSMAMLSNGRVSVLIPARNEEMNIERAVRSVAGQEDVRDVIVADDQSSDRTFEILQALEKDIPHLRVMRMVAPPEGWTGKAHAMAVAARAATGEWLLFTDADVEHRRGSLAAMLARAESEGADLLSLSPGQQVNTWWEKGIIPLVFVNLARQFDFRKVSDPKSPLAAANGQYILIRRRTYDRAGGHEAGRGEILDDVDLARRVKASGGRIIFLPGAAWVEARMYRAFSEMWEGWTKNLCPLFGGRMNSIWVALFDVLLVEIAPLLGLMVFLAMWFRGTWPSHDALNWGPGAVLCILAAAWSQRSYRQALRRLGFAPELGNYVYLGAPLFSILLLNSARVYSSGRVRWKGREYSTSPSSKGTA